MKESEVYINIVGYLETVNQILRKWFNPSINEFLRNGQPMPNMTVNTMLTFLGKALKELFRRNMKTRLDILAWIGDLQQGDKYRLYLYLSFIEQMGSIYSDGSTFVECKQLLKSFET